MEITAYGNVCGSVLNFHGMSKLTKELAALEGKEVEISIRRKKKYRSSPQNRYYWGAVIPSLKYGMESKGFLIKTKEQVHDLMKYKFLKGEILNVADGEILETIGSTSNLSTSAFMDFITEIKVWAATFLSCEIPEPNEQLIIAE